MGVFQGKDVIPRSDRRASRHDYQGRGLCMLTFRKNGPVEDFCAIADNPVRGQRLNPQIRLSESGEALTRAILRFGHENPALQVLRHMVMPDHLHLLKKLLPEMFVRKNRLVINGKAYMAFGNPLLLREPEKEMVLVRSYFTPEEVEAQKERWRRSLRPVCLLPPQPQLPFTLITARGPEGNKGG